MEGQFVRYRKQKFCSKSFEFLKYNYYDADIEDYLVRYSTLLLFVVVVVVEFKKLRAICEVGVDSF